MKQYSTDKLQAEATRLLSKKQYANALTVCKNICRLDGDNPDAWLMTGSVAGKLGRYNEAEFAFQEALKLRRDITTTDYLARTYEALGKLTEAIDLLTQAYNSNLDNKEIMLKIGILLGKSGDFLGSIRWLEKYISIDPGNAHAHHCLASALESSGEPERAIQEFKAAIAINTHDFQLHNNYGVALQETGKWQDAITEYRKSISINPQYPVAHYNLADAYCELGKFPEAILSYSSAIQLKPDYTEAYTGLGRSYRSSGEVSRAIQYFKQAISLDSQHLGAHTNLARALISHGDYDQALEEYLIALEIDPENINTLCAIATLHERRGEYTRAIEIMTPLTKSNPYQKNVALTYGVLSRKLDTRDIAINRLESALLEPALSPKDTSNLHYMLGKLYDDTTEYNKAFVNFKAANDLLPFDVDWNALASSVKALKDTFSLERLPTYARSGNLTRKPVFIVGMPRSGTTLVEQIIASHPQVYGAGELPYISELVRNLPAKLGTDTGFPENVTKLTADLLQEMGDEYLAKATTSQTVYERVTDKMPHNFRLLGFIELLFPQATIIHCSRDPLDTCLSIYANSFVASHPYATKLESLARYYTDYYQPIMAHWHSVLNLRILEVNYEALVDNQEENTRRLLEHCGLNWHEQCLNFHKTKRDVATLSYDQVRQPIYSKSRGRWRNYEQHIQPLIRHFQEAGSGK